MKSFKLLLILSLLLLCSCKESKPKDGWTDTLTSGTIPIAVDEGFKPIIEEERAVFEGFNQEVHIKPTYCSEVDAINKLLKDSVRLVISTRRLSSDEMESFTSRKFVPREVIMAYDGVGLIVNNQNPDTLITVDQVRKILTGKITKWNEIYPKSKLGNIQIVFDNSNSSTVRFAKDSICKGKPFAKKGIYAQKTNLQVFDYVSKTENAIGVIGVNWLGVRSDTTNLTFKTDVRVMAVSEENEATSANSYKPYQAYIALGNYPFIRTVYMLLNDPRMGLSTGFANFIGSDRGQRIILRSGLVPATQPLRIVNVKD
ncbi:phosphate ABC transporter substrate-binding protein [Bacteroides sedimenti]|uniref:Phosphate ABC transporter substrate-binding protein n=2 Tax=Bacteroides sedimenti TaxID=2136147 RepID=A0ABM8IEL7_9BACE